MELYLILTLSLLIGIRHAMEPDHVAAMLVFSTQSRSVSASVKQGTIWSLGHSMTLVVFSLVLMVLEIEINAKTFVWFELIVGIIIIMMGVELICNPQISSIQQSSMNKFWIRNHNPSSIRHPFRAFGVGLAHGAAGSGVVIALATTMLDSMYLKLGYIILFSIGLTIGVSLLSILLKSSLFLASKKEIPNKCVSIAVSLMILLVGVKLIYDVTESIPLIFV